MTWWHQWFNFVFSVITITTYDKVLVIGIRNDKKKKHKHKQCCMYAHVHFITVFNIKQKKVSRKLYKLPDREFNPGLPHYRRGYWRLYYRGLVRGEEYSNNIRYLLQHLNLLSTDAADLRVFERKVLRKIFGLVRVGDDFRIRFNSELY